MLTFPLFARADRELDGKVYRHEDAWMDAFLETDVGIKKALTNRTEKEMRELSERWSPWRSYATISLWNSL